MGEPTDIDEEPLKHITRVGPLWATGTTFTVCGNAAKQTDVNFEEAVQIVRKRHRNSMQRAFNEFCVTCLNNAERDYRMQKDGTDDVTQIVTHFSRILPRRFPDEMKRRNAEAAAINRLIGEHYEEFVMLVKTGVHGLRAVSDDG